MTVIATMQDLPLGFRFHPTDEDLVNHYLKRKITGRIRSEIEVIPEIDVCKCEPWDLPDKSLIKSDDPEWFFFARKDRKYPNGRSSNRATEAGFWKSTGVDRFIRTKGIAAKRAVIGMKKTLVFHRGRAPDGVRTNWKMHEYRTTEPEFESGEQGGYVLLRLFNNPEERISMLSTDEVETSGYSPTPTKSSPDDAQNGADAMEEVEMNNDSPNNAQDEPHSLHIPLENQSSGVMRRLADTTIPSTNCFVGQSLCNLTHHNHEIKGEKGDPLPDVLAQLGDIEFDTSNCDAFPNVTSPMLPYTDHPFFENIDHRSNTLEQDYLDEFLNSMLNPDDNGHSDITLQKDIIDANESKSGFWDSASCKDSGSCSDIDTETGFTQINDALIAENNEFPLWFDESTLLSKDSLQMDTLDGYPGIKPQFCGNAHLLPCVDIGPDVCSVDTATESLQELLNSMDETSLQRNNTDNINCLEGTGIKIRRHIAQNPPSDHVLGKQGTAARRIRLRWPIEDVNSSNFQKNTMINDDATEVTGIKTRTQELHKDQQSPKSSKVLAQHGTIYEPLSQSLSSVDESVSDLNDRDTLAWKKAEEHVGDNFSDAKDSGALLEKLEESPVHDGEQYSEEPKVMLRRRPKLALEDQNIQTSTPSSIKASRSHSSIISVIWMILSVVLVLICLGMCMQVMPRSI